MRKRNSASKAKLAIFIACIFLAAVISVIIISAMGNEQKEAEITDGVAYIKTMEAKDPIEIENSINYGEKEEKIEEIKEQVEQQKGRQISVDPSTVWTSLEQINTAIIGDSRVTMFINFMNGVYANVGDYIFNIPDFYGELQVQNPGLIVISYGVNDAEWYGSAEEHCTELMGYLRELEQMFPNAYIYYVTPMEALPIAEEWDDGHPGLCEKLKDFAEVESKMLTENGFRVIDGAQLGREHIDCYEPDGMHFTAEFYPYWGQAILEKYLADSTT